MNSTTNRQGAESWRGLSWVLPVLACLAAGAARAAETELKPEPELRREIAGHNFIASRFSLDPFVSTFVAAETGFGYGSATGHTFDLNGNPLTTADLKVGAFAQYLEYQYGFTDWWALRAQVRILVYSGLNSSGLAGVGTTINASPTIGTTFSFKVGDRLRLGGALDVVFGPSVFFNIVEAVRDSIANGEITSPVNSYSQFTVSPAFVGAWAISKPFGFTFSVSYHYTHASNDSANINVNLLSATGVFDFDMAQLDWIPMGLLAGFSTDFSVSKTSFLSFRYQFGIFYTGVKPLNVGFEILYNRAPVVGSTEVFLSSLIGLIVLQYNFN